MTACEKCSTDRGVPVYRNGPKGQLVEWRCWEHLDPEWKEAVPSEARELCEAIHRGVTDESMA